MAHRVPLADVADLSSGGTPSKSRPEYWGGDVPWLSAKDMKSLRVNDTEDHVTVLGAANGTRWARRGSTLLLTRGMTLLTEVPVCFAERDLTFNQDVKAIAAKPGVNPTYLFYALLAARPLLHSMVDLAGHGTGRLPTDRVVALPVWVPSLGEQNAIAEVLGALDDKIELNRRMNETLEAMARALFKSWFVDFDPVRAKAEGRAPAGMDAATANLFSAALTRHNSLQVPQGWSVLTLDDMLELQRGFDLPSAERIPGPFPVVQASGVAAGHAECKVRGPGVVTGRSGVLGRVFFVHEDFWPLNTTLWVRDFRRARPHFAYYLLQLIDFAQLNAGSAVPTLNRNHLRSIEVVAPPAEVVDAFEASAAPLLARMHHNAREMDTLSIVRDTLLPKLLSGELRVRDADRIVEQAV